MSRVYLRSSLLMLLIVLILLCFNPVLSLSVLREQLRSALRLQTPMVWSHSYNPLTLNLNSCNHDAVQFDGECINPSEFGSVRYDPCNPKGQRVYRTPWQPFNGRKGIRSPGLGVLERQRMDCLIFPRLVVPQLLDRMQRNQPVNLSSISPSSERSAPFLNPLRVLVFGPQGEQGKMRQVMELALHAGKYPVDYVLADLDPRICNSTGAIPIDAQSMPFPNDFFSVVVMSHVLEHIPDMQKGLAEVYRVLEPHGFALLNSPIRYNVKKTVEDSTCVSEECRQRKFHQYNHVRIMGWDSFDIIAKHFDDIRYGFPSAFVRQKEPDLVKIFANPEYHLPDFVGDVYVYAFKGVHAADIASVFP